MSLYKGDFIGGNLAIFNIFGKKDVSELTKSSPYRIFTSWTPYKLYASRKESCTLGIRLKNMTGETLLTSVVVSLPENLAFDQMGLTKEREVRLGEMAMNEEKEVNLDVYATGKADIGEYTVNLTACAHYRDYGHILNLVKKRTTLEVVD